MDTGSDVCVVPKTFSTLGPIVQDGRLFSLSAANGSTIHTYGTVSLTLDLDLDQKLKWNFILADVKRPIIGLDFLSHFKLLIDVDQQQLLDRNKFKTTPVKQSMWLFNTPSVTSISGNSPFHDLLRNYPTITKPPGVRQKPNHNITHRVLFREGVRIIPSKLRRITPLHVQPTHTYFDELLEQGVIRHSSSEHASALHIVPKKDGSLRFCGDYRQINAATIPDRYPLRHIHDFSQNLADCKVYSTLDALSAYSFLPIHEDDIGKTAIITPFGLFEYLYMPFGLRNSGATYQKFMDQVTKGLPFVFAYLDDILVASPDEATHLEHLRAIFERFKEYGVVLNPSKCTLGVSEVDFLGYHVSCEGLTPKDDKVKAILDFPAPTDYASLRRWLGMYNFYRRHIPSAAKIQGPLNDFLKGPKNKGRTPLVWTTEAENAFKDCKRALADCAKIAHPRIECELSIASDSSNIALGGVLQQFYRGAWQPLAFFSKRLSPAHQKLSAYDRELMAIHQSIKYFRYAIEGRVFTVYTDHKPITFAFKLNREQCSPRQFRMLDYISQFSTDIRHIKGQANIVADLLSRPGPETDAASINDVTANIIIDYATLAEAQLEDSELEKLRNCTKTALKLELTPIVGTDKNIYCDVSNGQHRPYIPSPFRRQIFDKLHNISHAGIKASTRLVSSRFVWPSMNKDCKLWAQSCHNCQSSKIHRHVHAPLSTFNQPSARFQVLHIDLVGPLPICDKMRYLLTIIDRFSRWIEVIPIPDMFADTVCKAIYKEWICRFGCPLKIIADQGRQFESDLFKSFASLFGIQLSRTTAYHPQCNGQIERMHRTLKAALKAHNHKSWLEILPTVVFGLRIHYKEDIQASAAEMVYGEPLRVPGEFLFPSPPDANPHEFLRDIRHTFSTLKPVPASRHDNPSTFVYKALKTCPSVYLRDDTVRGSLQRPYTGPYPVISRKDKTFKILKNAKHVIVSIDRLKPAFTLANHVTFESPGIVTPPVATIGPAVDPTANRGQEQVQPRSTRNPRNNTQARHSNTNQEPAAGQQLPEQFQRPEIVTRYGRRVKPRVLNT